MHSCVGQRAAASCQRRTVPGVFSLPYSLFTPAQHLDLFLRSPSFAFGRRKQPLASSSLPPRRRLTTSFRLCHESEHWQGKARSRLPLASSSSSSPARPSSVSFAGRPKSPASMPLTRKKPKANAEPKPPSVLLADYRTCWLVKYVSDSDSPLVSSPRHVPLPLPVVSRRPFSLGLAKAPGFSV